MPKHRVVVTMSQTNSLSITTGTQQLKMESESARWIVITEELAPDYAMLSQVGTQTQKPDSQDIISQSVPPPITEKEPWGFLSCIRSNLTIRLVNDQFLVGRSNPSADYTFDEKLLSRHYRETSRQHFRISRTQLKSGQWLVSIEDLSTCGTFINGVLIGKKKNILLLDKNIISVNRPELEVFMFYDQQYKIAVPGIPDEITANYLITDHIGKGGFGSVYLVIKQNSRKKLAMKAVKLEGHSDEPSRDRTRLLNEPDIMYKIRHPNIVQITDVYISKGAYLFIFMEYVQGGDLQNYLNIRKRNLNEAQAKFIFYQLISAVTVLHKQNIVHRDIKPLNILCSHKEAEFPHIKLTDFGLSKSMTYKVEAVQTLCGTKAFAAPELNLTFRNDRKGKQYFFDARSDIWSVGIVFYYCLCRRRPYVDVENDIPTLDREMRKNNFKFLPVSTWKYVDFEAKYLIRRMLRYDCMERPTAEDLFKKEYFTKDLLLNRQYGYVCLNKTTRSGESSVDENTNCTIPKKMARLDNNS